MERLICLAFLNKQYIYIYIVVIGCMSILSKLGIPNQEYKIRSLKQTNYIVDKDDYSIVFTNRIGECGNGVYFIFMIIPIPFFDDCKNYKINYTVLAKNHPIDSSRTDI